MFGRKRSEETVHADLLSDLKRGRAGGLPPVAAVEHFPSAEAIATNPDLAFDPVNREGKVFLGLVNATMQHDTGSPVAQGGHLVGVRDDRHLMIVAGSRAGKGRSLLLPLLATWPGSVIVIDPKLDLASETAALRSRFGRVQVVDPFNAASAECNPYRASGNPLSYQMGQEDDDLLDLAMLIADGLIVMSDKDPHWDVSARMFLEAVILHVMTWPAFEGQRDLATVHRMIMRFAEDGIDDEEQGSLPTLQTQMLQNEAVSGAVITGAMSYYDREDRERGSVLSTLRRHLHFLSYGRMRRALSDGDVDPRRFHDQPTSFYLGLPATKLAACAGLPRLFINLFLASFEAANDRSHQHQTGGHPCLLIMDEFFSLGRMDRIEAAAGQIAGFGVKLCPVLQDLSQLKAMYPKSWETFAANCGVMSFFGNQDLTTLEFLEKRLGKTQVRSAAQSDTSYNAAVKEGSTGTSFSMVSHPLMSVPELARIFNRDDPLRRQLVLSATHGPMILQRAFYDQHERLKAVFEA